MNFNWKRYLSLVMAIMLIISLVPTNFAHAEESESETGMVVEPEGSTLTIYNAPDGLKTEGNVNLVAYVAQIGEQGYESLQAAIDAAYAAGGDVTITLLDAVAENVTVTEKVGLYLTIDGKDKTMYGNITFNSLSDTNDNRRTTVQNVNFVTDGTLSYFIKAEETNHYPRLSVLGCSFTGTGNDATVAVRTKSAYDLIIKNCSGTGLHSFLQNTSGVKITVQNVTVSDSKGGLAMGTAQNVEIRNCNLTTRTYGIRLDAVLDTSVTLNGNIVNAYIPVSVRKATATDYKMTMTGSGSSYTATNTDGVWMAICADEYEEGVALNKPTGNVKIAWYTNLDKSGVYGAYEWPVEILFTDGTSKGFDTLTAAMNYGTSQTIDKIVVHEDITEEMDILEGNITTDNPNGVTIKNTIVDAWIYCSENFTIGEGVTYDATGYESGLFMYADNAVINGTVLTDCYYQRYENTKLTINEPGSMTVKTETFILRDTQGDGEAGIYIVGDNDDTTIGLNASVIYFYQGCINAKDADIKVGTYWQTQTTDANAYANAGAANLILDNTNMTVTVNEHNFKATGDSTVTLTNGSHVTVAGGYEGVAVVKDATSTFTVARGEVPFVVNAAQIGNVTYKTVAEALAAAKDGDTVIILAGEHSEGTIKLPATLNNVTIKGEEGAVLKDTTISAADGNSYSYIGLTFDGLTFDNGRILLTGWRNGEEIIENLTLTNCTFKNLNDDTNSAPVHINKDASKAVKNFTFTNNVIDGATGGSKSGVYAQVTGNVVFTGNTINNVSFRPCVIQLTTDDGIADEFIVTGNTFSGSTVGRAQGLGNNSEGTDTVKLVVSQNIFKGITNSQQICYWNFNAETTTADLSKNYYDIDIAANPSRIYYNSGAADVADLIAMGVYPYYKDEAMTELVTAPYIMVTYADGTVEYFDDMLEAVPYTTNYPKLEGATITLLQDTSGAGMRFMENDMVFDLNGHTYTITAGTGSQGTNTSGFQIRPEVTTNVIFKNGTIKVAEGAPVVWMFNCYATDFIVENVTVDCTNMAWSYGESCYVVVSRSGDNVQFVGNTKVINFNSEVAGAAINVGGTMTIADTVDVSGLTVELDAGATLTAKEGLNVVTVDGYKVVCENGVYSTVAAVYVAQIGETKYESLAEALAAAKAGETVTIFAGTYALPAMKAGITVVGEVNADGTPAVLLEGTLSGTLENLTLKNLHIKGGNAQRWAYAKGNLVFENVTFEATSVYALHFDGITEGANLLYKDCTIIGWAAMSGSPASCVFDGCTIKGNGSYGVIRTYFDATIENCTFDVDNVNTTDVYQDGIHAVGGAEVTVNNCTNVNGDMKDLVNISTTSVVVLDGVKIQNVAKVTSGEGEEAVTTYYLTLDEAVKAAQAGDEVTILAAGTYKVPTGKNITITGAVEGVKFDMSKAVGVNASMTFNNVTFEYGNANYVGLQHAGTMVYNDCTINGQVFLYGTSETFNNCTFNQISSGAYNVWTYGAKEVAFNECTFNSAGKSVLIYSEQADLVNNVTVTKSTFTASTAVDGKAAIEMDSSLTSGINLTIDGATTATGFGSGNVSGNSLWNNKKGSNTDANNDITVVVDGVTVLAPATFVAKIGDTGYTTIADAIKAANAGDTVTILAGDYTIDVSVNKAITVVGEGTVNITGRVSVSTGATVKNLNVHNEKTGDYDCALVVNGKDIVLDGVKLTGYNAMRYCYANGNITVKNSTINGNNFAVHFDGSNGGNIAFENCDITGWCSYASTIGAVSYTNCSIDQGNYSGHRYYNKNVSFTDCDFAEGIQLDLTSSNTKVSFTDGDLTEDEVKAMFANDGYYVAKGNITLNGNTITYAASANGKYYDTLQAAIDDIPVDGATYWVYLRSENVLEASVKIPAGKKLTLNLNGFNITGTDNATGSFALIEIQPGAELTIDGDGKITLTATNNRGWNAYSSVISNQRGKLVIENGTIEHLGGTDMAYGIDNLTNGKGTYAETVINGGTIKSTYRAIRQFLNGVEAQNILTVNGGTIEGANKSIWMQDPNTNANTGELTVSENAKLIGDVYLFVTPGSTEWPVEVSIADAAFEGNSTVLTGNVPDGYVVENANGTWGVRTATYVAQIGEKKYESLQAAINAATAGQTVTLLADITEDVTVNKSLTIDGAGKTYTGKMTLSNKADIAIKNVNFDGKGYNGYAINSTGAYYITIEDCTAKNYGYGFVQIANGAVLTTVKNVTVSDCAYGIKIDYSNAVVLDNVKLSCSVAGLLNSNYGAKTITVKGSEISILGTWTKNDTVKTTYVFEGENTVGQFVIEATLDTFKLADVNSTLTAPNTVTVTTDVADYEVKYENGTYKLVEKVVAPSVHITLNTDNMTLGNSLALNFWVYKDQMIEGMDYTAKLVRTRADGSTETVMVPMSDWVERNTYYQVVYSDFAAKEMTDTVSIVILVDGIEVSNTFTDSIKAYAEFMLSFAGSSAELKTALVDMLNYGAAAQKQFEYKTDDLANADLTDAQKALATQSVTPRDQWSGTGNAYASNLELVDNIVLKLWFKNVTDDMYAVVTYTGHDGTESTKTVSFAEFECRDASKGYYAVPVDELVVADGMQVVTCKLYNGNNEEVGSITESVESYIAYMMATNQDTNGLYEATMKFVASSYNLFH